MKEIRKKFFVIKKSLLDKICREVPSMLNYKVHVDKDSMFNTPPVFAVYTCLLSLKWLAKNGGIDEIEKKNILKYQKYLFKLILGESLKNQALVLKIC